MKAQTWENKKVKEAIDKYGAKLIILDEANKEHKKYFLYYKISQYPTIIFLAKDNLENPVYRSSGFMDAETTIKKIKENLDDE